ncbi:MAG: S6e family ribosomal protein [Thermoplasmata archaeon]|nr:S6e family ribosomal protein [Thermoplasmata archaeon]
MAEFKLVISEQEKSIARTVGDPQSAGFLGKRIGESVGGELLGAGGYTFRITGGTDKSGFPLRPDLPGARQTRLYVGDGFGFNAPRRGMRRRRTFRGNTISEETVQINLVVAQKGPKPLAELFAAT